LSDSTRETEIRGEKKDFRARRNEGARHVCYERASEHTKKLCHAGHQKIVTYIEKNWRVKRAAH